MDVPGLDGVAVGFRLDDRDAMERATAECGFEAVRFADREGIRAGRGEVDYLVAGGEGALEAVAAAGSVPTLFVGADGRAATRAFGRGADVFLRADDRDRLGSRIESLHVGACVDAAAVPEADAFGDVHRGAYRTLMRTFEDHVYVVDRHNRFVRVNDAKAAFHDADPGDLTGRSDFDLFPPETAIEVYRDGFDVLEGVRAVENKAEWVTDADGTHVHVTASKHPIEADGVVVGYLGISREITDLTRRAVLLRQMKGVFEYLYGTYDHNFRNQVQVQSGITDKFEHGLDLGRDVEARLADIEAELDRLEGSGGDGEDPPTNAASLRAAVTALEEAWTVAMDRFAEGHADMVRLTDRAETLVDAFGDLSTVVRIAGHLTDLRVDEHARDALGNDLDAEAVTVEGDDHLVGYLFHLVDENVDDSVSITLRDTPSGFDLRFDDAVDIPELRREFDDQDLSSVDPLLRVRLLAETQGWSVTTERDGDGTVVRFDVDAWKGPDDG